MLNCKFESTNVVYINPRSAIAILNTLFNTIQYNTDHADTQSVKHKNYLQYNFCRTLHTDKVLLLMIIIRKSLLYILPQHNYHII